MAVLKQYNENTQQWEAMNFVGDNFFSNRNLLDNPWFTINQRGLNSYSTNNAYTVDRWKLNNGAGGGSIAISTGGITFNGGSSLSVLLQNFEDVLFVDGTIFTVSAIIDGVIYSATVNTNSYTKSVLTSDVAINTSINSNYLQIEMQANKSHVVKAVKLELGPISTLTNDTTPNYVTELMKCLRYFVNIGGTYFMMNNAKGANYSGADYPLPTEMRIAPSISYSNIISSSGNVTITAGGFVCYKNKIRLDAIFSNSFNWVAFENITVSADL